MIDSLYKNTTIVKQTNDDSNDTILSSALYDMPKIVACMYRSLVEKQDNEPLRCITKPKYKRIEDYDAEIIEETKNFSLARKGTNESDVNKKFIGDLDAKCKVSKKFVQYYFILFFLLCFVTPVLITTSLNVFIHSVVHNTTYEVSNFSTFFDAL